MLRALLIAACLTSCAPAVKHTFSLTVTHVGGGKVTGPSGEYEVAFSPGWVRTSAEAPLFVPGAFADERLAQLATQGDALGYIGTEGAPFPENLAATYSDAQLHAGHWFSARFEAVAGAQLSFGCMFGQSNDTIAGAPAFALFDGDQPLEGDVSDHLAFYDVGVEVNEEPGFGAHQPGRGAGGTSERAAITRIDGTDAQGHVYPELSQFLRVELELLKRL